MISNEDGMFNSRQESCQKVGLENFARFLAYNNF